MKYYSIQTAMANPEIVRQGVVVYADKLIPSLPHKGFAFIYSNGRRVFLPYTEISAETIKKLHVSLPVSFTLKTDGKNVWATNIVTSQGRLHKRYLFDNIGDFPTAIDVKEIKKIRLTNIFHTLDEALQRESDNRHIPRKLYDCISIETIGDVYRIFNNNSPVKGDYKVENIEKYIDELYITLNIGHFESPETYEDYQNRRVKEIEQAEISRKRLEKIRNDISFVFEVKDSNSDIRRYILLLHENAYVVSHTDKFPISDEDESIYNGLAEIEYKNLAKKYNARLPEGAEDKFITFPKLTHAISFAKELIIQDLAHSVREEAYDS